MPLREPLVPTSGVAAWANEELWNSEYSVATAIPSSHRQAPARALSHYATQRGLAHREPLRILDLGAGTGRNSRFLARLGHFVHAVDISQAACAEFARQASAEPAIDSHLRLDCETIGLDIAVDGRYDLVLDSYLSCHLLSVDERLTFLESARRLLTKGGEVLTVGMGEDDTYYNRHRERGAIALDPLNGIRKLLQPREFAASGLSRIGRVTSNTTHRFLDRVNGRSEERHVLASVIRS